MAAPEKILVIKLGALGDAIQAIGPLAAIRRQHKDAHITILTTLPYADLFRHCPYVDTVQVDVRPVWNRPCSWIKLRAFLRGGGFTRVYDLQNSDRSSFYFRLFFPGPWPEWVGVARGASHRNTSPERTAGTAFQGHIQTLGLAGVTGVEPDKLEWMKDDVDLFNLPVRFVLIVSGSAPQRPEKRWPAPYFAALCRFFIDQGSTPVLLGTTAEKDIIEKIKMNVPEAIDLSGQTDLFHLPELARRALCAVGNDTGPMHLIAATGCPTLTLFDTRFSTPHRHQPMGARSYAVACEDLQTLSVEKVIEEITRTVWPGPAPAEDAEGKTAKSR